MTRVSKKEMKGRENNWKISAVRALQTLEFSGITNDSTTNQRELVNALLNNNTVVELDGLNEGAKKFLIPMLCLWIYYAKLESQNREKLEYVIFVEEAHNVLYRRQSGSESTMEMLLLLCSYLKGLFDSNKCWCSNFQELQVRSYAVVDLQ